MWATSYQYYAGREDGAPENIERRCDMTLEEIKASNKAVLSVQDVSRVLELDPHTLRCTARQRPELLGFPFVFSGNRMKIPRIPFLRFLGIDI